MAVHVVGFKDAKRFDGNTLIIFGRELVDEIYDTSDYKKIKPGESHTLGGYHKEIIDFVSADSFIATLEVSHECSFSSNNVLTLKDSSNNTFYPMFTSDFIIMSMKTVIDHGVVKGRFGYVKKNKNFGITYLGED